MGDLPSIDNIVSLLQKYRKAKDLFRARHAGILVCNIGLDTHHAIGNHVVPMLVECGSVLEAEKAFFRLVNQNIHSWTSIMSGFIGIGDADKAFELYRRMKEANIHPSSHTFVVLIKACGVLKDIERGRGIHEQSIEEGYKEDAFVCSTLMDMYFKCDLPSEAHDIFNNMSHDDVVLWNTLITGYLEVGLYHEALMCFKQMRQRNCAPNSVTFASGLKACGCSDSLHIGRKLHTDIVRKFLEDDPLVANTLVDMYTKCNSLLEAQAVFDKMSTRDVVSWNALIAGYVEHAEFQEALVLYERMQSHCVSPDAVTFVCALRACAGIGAIEKGRALDFEISNKSLTGDLFVGNALIDMYAKCGSLPEAYKVLYDLPACDVVSWNALIAGYVEHGPCDKAIDCFEQMQVKKVGQDAFTYVCIIKACSNLGYLEMGRRVHLDVSKKGLEIQLFVGSTLVDFYGTCSSLMEAEDAFKRLQVKDVASWDLLIACYVEQGCYQKALTCLEEMRSEHFSPTAVTLSSSLKACGCQNRLDKGRVLNNEALEKGFDSSPFVSSALVDMYAQGMLLADARNCFNKLPSPDIASWNALMAGYVNCEASAEALDVYEEMDCAGVYPNHITHICVLKACGMVGVLEIGQSIHSKMTLTGGFMCNLYVQNALVDMYVKCGVLSEAWDVIIKLEISDVSAWNAVIKGFGMIHDGYTAMQVFLDMQKHGLQPDAITFTCLLTACSRSSLVLEGQEFFKVMVKDYGVIPSVVHQNCVIDLLARSGYLYEAQKCLQTIACYPSEVLWTLMLSSSKTFVKAQIGLTCFEELVHMKSGCASAYLLLADVYASSEIGDIRHKQSMLESF